MPHVQGGKGVDVAAARPVQEVVRPPRWLRNGTLQTVVGARRPRGVGMMLPGEQPVLLDGGPDETGYSDRARLLAYFNRALGDGPSRGLVIFLHGWEGCSHSLYNLMIGARLLEGGYDLLRLNLRDHGPGYHVDAHSLNPGLFRATMDLEATIAAQYAARWSGGAPVYLVGPSLGGSFVLRMAMRQRTHPIANLAKVVAINPAINPSRATDLVDSQSAILYYFRSRWAQSLRAKQARFPELYDFAPALRMAKVRPMTDWVVRRYTDYADAEEYFGGYAVRGRMLHDIAAPTTIITAADDPVVDVADFHRLDAPPHVDVQIHRYGGHVAYVEGWPLRHRLPELILAELMRA
jgi:predicted alpha/beta-fold hydrolase